MEEKKTCDWIWLILLRLQSIVDPKIFGTEALFFFFLFYYLLRFDFQFLFQVEHIIREENMMAAQEILELFSELIAVRLPIIESQR